MGAIVGYGIQFFITRSVLKNTSTVQTGLVLCSMTGGEITEPIRGSETEKVWMRCLLLNRCISFIDTINIPATAPVSTEKDADGTNTSSPLIGWKKITPPLTEKTVNMMLNKINGHSV